MGSFLIEKSMKGCDHMTVEVAILVSVCSFILAFYTGISNLKRSKTNDDRNEATEMTTVIVKLENIGTGITEIKSEMSNVKNDLKESRERIIKIEESTKQAHKRLDLMEQRRALDNE